jgi:hypothetical protein
MVSSVTFDEPDGGLPGLLLPLEDVREEREQEAR